jgi:hypothetical protein
VYFEQPSSTCRVIAQNYSPIHLIALTLVNALFPLSPPKEQNPCNKSSRFWAMEHHVNASHDFGAPQSKPQLAASNLNRAMAQNNPNIAHQPQIQSLGNFPSSYDQFFAGNSWPRPSQSANPGASLSRQASNPMPSTSALQQPWEHQNVPLSRSSLNDANGQQMSNNTLMAAYQQSNQYAGASNPTSMVHYPSSHYPTMPHLQQNSQPHPASTAAAPNTISHQAQAPKLQPSSYGPYKPSAVQQQSVVYVQYSQPQQVPQSRPAYQNGNQSIAQNVQYPQATSYQTTMATSHQQQLQQTPQTSSLLSQAHQPLSDPPPAEPLSTNPNFSVINPQTLCDKTNSTMISPLLAVSHVSVELPHTKGRYITQVKCAHANGEIVAQLPRFDARKNLLELRRIAPQDPELKCKLLSKHAAIPCFANEFVVKLEKLDKKVRSRMVSGMTVTAQYPGGAPISKASPISSSEDESEDESDESEDELEIEEKAPIPASRPTDPVKGAEYDVIKAVWHSRSMYIENDVLLQRIAQFSELFIKLRDRWKFSNDALKIAKEKGQSDQASLTNKVNQNRGILEVALRAAVLHGHPHIISM